MAKHQLKAGVHVSPRRSDQSAQGGLIRALGDAFAPAICEHKLDAGFAAGPSRFRQPAQRSFVRNAGDAEPPCRCLYYWRTSGGLVAALSE